MFVGGCVVNTKKVTLTVQKKAHTCTHRPISTHTVFIPGCWALGSDSSHLPRPGLKAHWLSTGSGFLDLERQAVRACAVGWPRLGKSNKVQSREAGRSWLTDSQVIFRSAKGDGFSAIPRETLKGPLSRRALSKQHHTSETSTQLPASQNPKGRQHSIGETRQTWLPAALGPRRQQQLLQGNRCSDAHPPRPT